MPSVVHVVATDAFAGVERYVADVARETAARGWNVTVVGGDGTLVRRAAGDGVRWLPGATVATTIRSLARAGRHDVCHAHMTAGELAAVATRRAHGAPVVSTRHFAAARGASTPGRLVAPWISRRLARQLAVSEFVAHHVERSPDAVLPNGVRLPTPTWSATNRTVLVLQRLEREKDSEVALHAFAQSRLAESGWSLRIVGDGAERERLERLAAEIVGVTFAGWSESPADELASAGLLLAPAPAEPFGLAVVEAMAAGVPVVASAGGGHLETAGRVPGAALFAPGDVAGAAAELRRLVSDDVRRRLSDDGRRVVSERFLLDRHVDRLLEQYAAVAAC